MPKVLRIINRFNLGGITYNVSYLSRYMPPEFETLLIGGPEEAGEESSLYIPQALGLKPVLVEDMRRSINPLQDYFAYRKIKKLIKEFKPDIVHTHASKAGAVGRLAAAACRVPVIVHTFHGHVFHGYFSKPKTLVFKALERYLAGKSTAIVTISHIQQQELTEVHAICGKAKTVVIPLGFDLDRFTENKADKRNAFRKKYGLQDDELAIGIIGRLAPIKNHQLFIDAIDFVLKNSTKKIRALIIGDGDIKPELTAYINSKQIAWANGASDKAVFIFTSWIREVDVALAGLDLVALTSRNEGTPVSLIEAQAAGKFVITTEVGGIKDILNPDCGFLSPSEDLEAYQKNLLRAVEDFEALNLKAETAGQAVLEKFSYKRLCRDMAALYNKLLKK